MTPDLVALFEIPAPELTLAQKTWLAMGVGVNGQSVSMPSIETMLAWCEKTRHWPRVNNHGTRSWDVIISDCERIAETPAEALALAIVAAVESER